MPDSNHACNEPDRDDCLWAAAFFDGEGCVSLSPGSGPTKVVRVQVVIGNTDLAVLEWYRERWGGTLLQKRDTIQRRPQWQWYLKEREMPAFFRDIGPFLKIKRPAVENAYALLRVKLQLPPRTRRNEAERAELVPFLEAHRALNLDLRPHVLRRRMRSVA